MKKLAFIIILLIHASLAADEPRPVKFSGLAQIIPYLDGRDLSNATYAPFNTSMKLRLGAEKWVSKDIGFVFEIQDSRVFGSDSSLVRNTGNLDLSSGFVIFKNILSMPVSALIGRYQLEYGSGRFISKSGWNYIERVFDGAKFNIQWNSADIDIFASTHTADIGVQRLPAIPNTLDTAIPAYDAYRIFGIYAQKYILPDLNFYLLGYWENNADETASGDPLLNRFTIASEFDGHAAGIKFAGDLGYQFGEEAGRDISAYLISFMLTYPVSDFNISGAFDIHSGTKPEDQASKVNIFDNNLSTRHAFFGMMDYFGNYRTATAGLGINDYYLKAEYRGFGKKWRPSLAVHSFHSDKESSGGLSRFGEEADLLIRYYPNRYVFLELGSGVFFPGDLMTELWSRENVSGEKITRDDPGFTAFLRINLSF